MAQVRSPRSRFRMVWVAVSAMLTAPGLVGASVAAGATSAAVSGAQATGLRGLHFLSAGGAAAPTDAQCRAQNATPCYSPQEMRRAYGVDNLIDAGATGKGQSIVIIDSFGSPTIATDLRTFDAGYGLPDPPSLRVLAPLGTVPFDPTNSVMVGWAAETTLDVEWAHAMAPGASLVLMTSPVAETEGVQGLPEFLRLEKYARDRHLGSIFSQSWGATENTLFSPAGRALLEKFNDFYLHAGQEGITVLASAGDSGSANVNVAGQFYPFPTVNFPASSPYVTAVGGTSLVASTHGVYQSESVWNDSSGATGGGVSQLFAEPSWQRSLPPSDQALLGGHRAIPDVAYNASGNTAILIYLSFIPGQPGYFSIGGTSEGSPQWAGIIADANQAAGHNLGFLNPALYQLGASGQIATLFRDITTGNNAANGVPGYSATVGWDPTTGWGTPHIPDRAAG